MTREEAIKQMEEFMVIDDWSLVYLPDLHDALELAIEALTENESLAKSVIEASELLRKKRPHDAWIPCSERLPEDPDTKRIYVSKTYQVTTDDGRTIVLLWHKTESRGKMVMRWEWHDGRIYHGDVLAWKPLSEPYKREGENE